MPRTIYKYTLPVTDEAIVEMPAGAEILPFVHQSSHYEINLWAIVEPNHQKENRRFEVYGTGNPFLNSRDNYIGTVVTSSGFVWHIFEVK
jgi:hypothetical protein